MIISSRQEFGGLLRTQFLSCRQSTARLFGMRSVMGIQSKSGAIRRSRPLVGFMGIGNSISVQRRPDVIHCRVSTGTYVFLLAGTATFGPALGFLLYFRPERLEPHIPGLILGAVWLLSILSSVAFVRYALGCPRFTASFITGDIRYFAWWGSAPSLILRRGEIRTLEVEERFFLNEGSRVPNYCLIAISSTDQRYAVCVSTDEQLIRGLKSELEKLVLGTM
jgi:hypothetical protein